MPSRFVPLTPSNVITRLWLADVAPKAYHNYKNTKGNWSRYRGQAPVDCAFGRFRSCSPVCSLLPPLCSLGAPPFSFHALLYSLDAPSASSLLPLCFLSAPSLLPLCSLSALLCTLVLPCRSPCPFAKANLHDAHPVLDP